MPRRSIASLSIATLTPGLRRLDPPVDLGPNEVEIFKQVVAAAPANHFAPEDLGLLSAYALVAAMERRAAEELQVSATVGAQPSPWLAVHVSMVNSMAKLTTRLRIGPRSRSHNTRTNKAPVSQSYYDQIKPGSGA